MSSDRGVTSLVINSRSPLLFPIPLCGDGRGGMEHDDGWCSDCRIAIGERKAACAAIDTKTSDRVGPLVTAIDVAPAWIDGEAARVIAACPGLAGEGQFARRTDREHGDAVV